MVFNLVITILGLMMWLIVVAVVIIITLLFPTFRGKYPNVWRSYVGSVVGIIAANLALAIALELGFIVLKETSVEYVGFHLIGGSIMYQSQSIGPLIASLIGGVAGFLISKRSRRMIPGAQQL